MLRKSQRLAIALVAAQIIATPLSAIAQSPARQAIQREIEAATRGMAEAFAKGNLLEVARYYADDAKFYKPSGHLVSGRREIDRFHLQIEKPVSWSLETVDFGGSADEPWQLVESTMRDGDRQHLSASRTMCLLIWRRAADGRLRIHMDMYTPVRD